MNKLSLRLKPEMSEIRSLQDEVTRFAEEKGWPSNATYQIALSLDELITNVLSHGRAEGKGEGKLGNIEVSVTADSDSLKISISDDGIAFNPLEDAPLPELDAPVATRAIGGLGVHIVRSTMDEVHYRREGGKNHITLLKKKEKEK